MRAKIQYITLLGRYRRRIDRNRNQGTDFAGRRGFDVEAQLMPRLTQGRQFLSFVRGFGDLPMAFRARDSIFVIPWAARFVGKRQVFNDREFAGGNKSIVAFERFQIA